jgi:SAM-dependent methyltransferase
MAKGADFWNERYANEAYAYGEGPNAFVEAAADAWIDASSAVLDLGAGEGRNAVFLAERGHAVTAADYASAGLRKAERLADAAGVDVEPLHVDVRSWEPDRTWDAVVTTFLHLAPSEQPRLYRLLPRLVRPGGRVLAEWFRPEQRTQGLESGGPPDADMMVAADDLRRHFPAAGIRSLHTAHPHLAEGPHHQGPAATVRLVWERPPENGPAHAR